jgi:serine/threonine protein phosphatase PrpC
VHTPLLCPKDQSPLNKTNAEVEIDNEILCLENQICSGMGAILDVILSSKVQG